MPDRAKRHAAILRLVREHSVPSQERLRELLHGDGFDVTQATLSRDIRDLGLVKAHDTEGLAHYEPPQDLHPPPSLATLMPTLLLKVDGVGPLLVLTTPTGSASLLAAALDHESWPEVIGSIAGDDTVLLICKSAAGRKKLAQRLGGAVSRR